MALNALGLGFIFTATDLASGSIIRLRRSFNALDLQTDKTSRAMTNNLKRIGVGFATLAAGGALLAPAFGFAAKAAEFEQVMTDVSLITGEGAEGFAKLRKEAINVALATQFSPVETTAGLKSLAQAGLDANEQIAALAPAIDLAAASLGQLEPAQAGGLAVQAMKGFGVEADQLSGTMDVLANAATQTNTEFKDLPLAVGILARGAQRLGNQSLPQTIAAFGLVRNVIPGVERAATSMTVAMERLADPKRRAKFKKAFGVDVVNKATGEFKDLDEIIKSAIPRFNEMTEAEQAASFGAIFGERAGGAFGIIINQLNAGIKDASGNMKFGAEAMDAYTEKLNKTGTAAMLGKKRLETMSGQMILMKGIFGALAIEIGEPFKNVLFPILANLRFAFAGLLAFIQQVPPEIKNMVSGVIFATGAFLTLAGAIKIMRGGIGLAIVAMRAFAASKGILAVASLATTLPAVAGAAIIFGSAMTENLFGIGDDFGTMQKKAGLAFNAISQLFTKGQTDAATTKDLLKAENRELLIFVEEVDDLLRVKIPAFFKGMREGMKEANKDLKPVFDLFRSGFDLIASAFAPGEEAMVGFKEEGKEAAETGATLGKIIIFTSAAFIALRGAVLIAQTAVLGYKAVVFAIRAVQAIWTGLTIAHAFVMSTKGALGKSLKSAVLGLAVYEEVMLGTSATTKTVTFATQDFAKASKGAKAGMIGMAAAAGLAGFEFGTWLEQTFKLSDALNGLNNQMDRARGAPDIGMLTEEEKAERDELVKKRETARQDFEDATDLGKRAAVVGGVGVATVGLGVPLAILDQVFAGDEAEERVGALDRQIAAFDAKSRKGRSNAGRAGAGGGRPPAVEGALSGAELEGGRSAEITSLGKNANRDELMALVREQTKIQKEILAKTGNINIDGKDLSGGLTEVERGLMELAGVPTGEASD